MKRALTGIRATGEVHLGNYLGTLRPALALQNEYECFYFIADLHALTTNREAARIAAQTYDVVATWLALGFDPSRHIIYRQSDIPLVCELMWYLGCSTGKGLIDKGHAFKDAEAQSKEVNFGVYSYPVLMAADILLYDVDVVPVGKDQVQHVEMCRDMAGSFNAIYGDIIKVPAVRVDEQVMSIPGLDGRKMSKSYNNTIPVFLAPDELKKRVLSIKTDSTPMEAPKSMKGSLLGQLFELLATREQYADLERRLNAGGLGWGHAKLELFEVIRTTFAASRERFLQLRADEAGLDTVLRDGAERATAVGIPVLNRIRQGVGLRKFTFSFS